MIRKDHFHRTKKYFIRKPRTHLPFGFAVMIRCTGKLVFPLLRFPLPTHPDNYEKLFSKAREGPLIFFEYSRINCDFSSVEKPFIARVLHAAIIRKNEQHLVSLDSCKNYDDAFSSALKAIKRMFP